MIGSKTVNKLVSKIIGKVITKARQRNRIAAKRRADPDKYQKINQAAQAKFYKEHKEQVLKWNQEQRAAKWDMHLKRTRERRKERRLTDEEYRIKDCMRARLRSALLRKGVDKTSATFDLVGCSSKELMKYLKVPDGNEIDHVFPFEWYNLEDQEQLKRVCHFTNLQPLTPKENNEKGAQLPTKAMADKVDPSCWPDGITRDMLPDEYPGWSTALRM